MVLECISQDDLGKSCLNNFAHFFNHSSFFSSYKELILLKPNDGLDI